MGFGAEIAAMVAEELSHIKIKRIAGENTPIPYSKHLEDRVIPSSETIVKAVSSMM